MEGASLSLTVLPRAFLTMTWRISRRTLLQFFFFVDLDCFAIKIIQ